MWVLSKGAVKVPAFVAAQKTTSFFAECSWIFSRRQRPQVSRWTRVFFDGAVSASIRFGRRRGRRAEGLAAEAVDWRGRAQIGPRQNRQASVIPAANPLASPPTISTVDGGRTGPPATNRCQPRQAWKGAAVAADSGAGVRLVGPPPSTHRRGVRAVEGARLESVYGLIAHRGFESLPLRHLQCVVR